MLPPEPSVLIARQSFAEAQVSMSGVLTRLGYYQAGWYGTEIDDERGSFAVVNVNGPLWPYVGDYLNVAVGHRSVYVYVIGSKSNLLSDIALTRRAYMAISLLVTDPIACKVSLSL